MTRTRIGTLNHRITIVYTPRVPDGQGGYTQRGQVETDLCTVWAEFQTPKTGVEITQGAFASVITQVVVIRRRGDVNVGYKVVEGNRTYRITNVYDINREFTGLVVQEVSRRGDVSA